MNTNNESDESDKQYAFMPVDESIRILTALADNKDPATGADLVGHSILQDSQVILAFARAIKEMRSVEPKPRMTTAQIRETSAYKHGEPWTEDDIGTLRIFTKLPGANLSDIAEKFGRTKGAIISQARKSDITVPNQMQNEMDAHSAQSKSEAKERRANKPKPRVSTPFASLDRALTDRGYISAPKPSPADGVSGNSNPPIRGSE